MRDSLSVNTLYYGDNLVVLRERVPDESVDLVYLDPPFNSNRNYNVLFAEHDAEESEAQIKAFEDTWHWDAKTTKAYREITDPNSESNGIPSRLVTFMEAMHSFLGKNDMMAYLVMMAIRLVDLRRVLKPTGSLYLHCDPTASHYLRLVLDAIFGPECFLSEVIWKRTSAHSSARRFGPVHDTILFYSKSNEFIWNAQFQPYDEDYINTFFEHVDEDGRKWKRMDLTGAGVRNGETGLKWRGIDVTSKGRHWAYPPSVLDKLDAQGKIHWPKSMGGMPRLKQYLDEMSGVPLQDLWADIRPLHNLAEERLGYPTQKPQELLERIIATSSNLGDVVLDPFCGCGTSIHAAQRLGRNWVGIDITHLAISLIRNRLNTAFPDIEYEVHGEPADAESARVLAETDPFQFQWWALHLIGARPAGDSSGREGKKGKDRGIDGVIRFKDDPAASKSERVIVSVKAGKHLTPAMVRDLRGTIDRENVPIGVLLTMYEPSAEMRREAMAAGAWTSQTWRREYRRIQIITVEEAFKGMKVDYPGQDVTLQSARRETRISETLPLFAAVKEAKSVSKKPKK